MAHRTVHTLCCNIASPNSNFTLGFAVEVTNRDLQFSMMRISELFDHHRIANHLAGGKVTNGTLGEVGAGIAGQYIEDAAAKVGF